MCYKKENKLYPMDRLGPLTRHHRRPRSLGGKHEGENISMVPEKLHNAYHLLFANNHIGKICEILNDHFVDTDYHIVAVPKEFLDTIFQVLSKNKKT